MSLWSRPALDEMLVVLVAVVVYIAHLEGTNGVPFQLDEEVAEV